MNQNTMPVRVTLWFNRVILAVLGVLVFAMPRMIYCYQQIRFLDNKSVFAVLIAFYCCVPLVVLALWKLDRLLRNILAGSVFVSENVHAIRTLRWCCLGVCLICLPAAFFYLPLVFMTVIMGFLSLVVNVVCQVMKAAVAIREENDLTV